MRPDSTIRPHDFRNPSKFAREHLRTLELLFDQWGRAASLVLGGSLRAAVEFAEVKAEETTYGDFHSALGESIIIVIDGDGLGGNILLGVRLGTAFGAIDRMLGGSLQSLEHGTNDARQLTEIERSLFSRMMDRIVGAELTNVWKSVAPISFELASVENADQLAQAISASEPIAMITVPVKIGEGSHELLFSMPHVALEPVIESLSVQEYFSRRLRTTHAEKTLAEQLPNVPIELVVHLDERKLTYSEIRRLQVGDILPLPSSYKDHAIVYAGKDKLFEAAPRTKGDHYVCQLRRVLPNSVTETLAESARKGTSRA